MKNDKYFIKKIEDLAYDYYINPMIAYNNGEFIKEAKSIINEIKTEHVDEFIVKKMEVKEGDLIIWKVPINYTSDMVTTYIQSFKNKLQHLGYKNIEIIPASKNSKFEILTNGDKNER